MTKREIIKWLKQEKVTALIKLGEEKDKAKRELCKKTYEEMNMADFYKEFERRCRKNIKSKLCYYKH